MAPQSRILQIANVLTGVADFFEMLESGKPVAKAVSRAIKRTERRSAALQSTLETLQEIASPSSPQLCPCGSGSPSASCDHIDVISVTPNPK
jgi:hypothetical protein